MAKPSAAAKVWRRGLGLAALLLLGSWPLLAFGAEEIVIFAAASTTPAMSEIARGYEAQGSAAGQPVKVQTVFAASSSLAMQITQGAPADLYLSASRDWMDRLDRSGALEPGGRVDLRGNRLALIAPKDRAFALRLAPDAPLAAALGEGRLAIGDPSHVPAGRYGAAALEALGLWDSLGFRLALAANVRGVLTLVLRGEASAGIVYRSDALGREDVVLVDLFPADSHPPIVYPLALVKDRDRPAVQAFAAYLRGEAAAAIFRRHGFLLPGVP